jgi:hypothetical protein
MNNSWFDLERSITLKLSGKITKGVPITIEMIEAHILKYREQYLKDISIPIFSHERSSSSRDKDKLE